MSAPLTSTHDQALARADRLEREGDLLAAIAELTEANRSHRSPSVERRLVDLRHRAVSLVVEAGGRESWPPVFDDPFGEVTGLPEIAPEHVDVASVGGGILHHGAVAVRGLLRPSIVERMVTGIDGALDEWDRRDEPDEDDDGPWLAPFDPGPDRNVEGLRNWVAEHRGLWLADVPTITFELLDEIGRAGVLSAIGGYFGERPTFSLEKSTLRRTPAHDRIVTWHQDGAFLDPGVRTVNLWIALSDCGGDADTPGLDVFPRRFDQVIEPDGTMVAHSVGFETIDRLAAETPTTRPEFAAGDALLFDELFLHRTGISPGMTRDRYAIECWFFAPSRAPASYTSFVA